MELVNNFFQDFTDRHVILFVSDCGLIIREQTAARADPPPGPELGTMFGLNLYNKIIDTGLPAQYRKPVYYQLDEKLFLKLSISLEFYHNLF